eukprot:704554-Pleurochrysis_carterae.AAC.3
MHSQVKLAVHAHRNERERGTNSSTSTELCRDGQAQITMQERERSGRREDCERNCRGRREGGGRTDEAHRMVRAKVGASAYTHEGERKREGGESQGPHVRVCVCMRSCTSMCARACSRPRVFVVCLCVRARVCVRKRESVEERARALPSRPPVAMRPPPRLQTAITPLTPRAPSWPSST